MVEKEIKQIFVKEGKKLGGIALKLVCPSFDGVLDLLVPLAGGRLGFVEVKASGRGSKATRKTKSRNSISKIGLRKAL